MYQEKASDALKGYLERRIRLSNSKTFEDMIKKIEEGEKLAKKWLKKIDA